MREQDFFATPVQLTYKGEREFNTAFGGCCTILLFLSVAISLAISLNETINDKKYTLNSSYTEYKPIGSSDSSIIMKTAN